MPPLVFISLAQAPLFPLPFSYPALAIELRLDLHLFDKEEIKKIISLSPYPILLTLRSSQQGGGFQGTRFEYETLLLDYLTLNPSFLDVEWEEEFCFLDQLFHTILKENRSTKLILSHHISKLNSSVAELKRIYQKMSRFAAYTYKIALTPSSTIETLLCLDAAKELPRLSLICMGERASFSRLLTPVLFPQSIQYAALSKEHIIAKGQYPLSELEEVYRYQDLTPETALFALIGDPIEDSIGHFYHNRVFTLSGRKALYLKIPLSQEELPLFFSLVKKFNFQGFSVTMPLKEQIVSFVDELDKRAQECRALNTLVCKRGKIYGTNTDGLGAIKALEAKEPLAGKRVSILGAGGAARAIAFEAKRRGSFVQIIGRSLEKTATLAKEVGGSFSLFSDPLPHSDVLINTTPTCPPLPFHSLLPSTLVMDIVYSPRETPFLKKAKDLQCKIVYGEEMFFNQAASQQIYWQDQLSAS